MEVFDQPLPVTVRDTSRGGQGSNDIIRELTGEVKTGTVEVLK